MKTFAFLSAIAKGYTSDQAYKYYLVLDELARNPALADEARSAIYFALSLIYRLIGVVDRARPKILQALKEADEEF